MKKRILKTAVACGLCLTVLAGSLSVSAAYNVGARNGMNAQPVFSQQSAAPSGQMGDQMGGQMNTAPGGQMGGQMNAAPGGQMGGQINAVPSSQMNMAPSGQMGGQMNGTQNNQMPSAPAMEQNTQAPDAAFGGQQQMNGQQTPAAPTTEQNAQVPMMGQNAQQASPFGQAQMTTIQSTADSASEIVTGETTNSAASLTADYSNATTVTMSNENNSVKIKEAGTYIVTGTCADGNITVTKGTTGVVLILKDLNLTSTEGAALAINKTAEAKIIVSGSVTLTDNENPDDENSTDADVADAYDGAAIKVKAGASVYITGTGTLNINGTAKNGIKAGDETVLVIDGSTVNITATNDAINGNYDVAILSGTLTISAGDDAIHADRILTVGADGSDPSITVKNCYEGIEATVVNLAGGTVNVTSTDDGVNAANSDGTYAGELTYSINVTGAKVTVSAPRADGFDSNGNINLVSGSATISSANNGGDAGIDYDGQLYISDEFNLNNQSGVAGSDNMMGGMPGQMGNQQSGQTGNQVNGQQNSPMGGQMNGQAGSQMGNQQSALMGGQMGAPMGGQQNGPMGGQMNGRMGR